MRILFINLLIAVLFTRLNGFSHRRHRYGQISTGMAVDVVSMRLLKDMYEASEDKNVVTSPLGVLMLLSLYAAGANGTTRDEIVDYLGFPNYSSMSESYQSLTKKFTALDPEFLTLANKVCVSNKYELTEDFRNVATRDYHSEVETLNFNNPQTAADSINQWAELKTRGCIKTPVTKDLFSADTAAMLLNVIFFKGKWMDPFDPEHTVEKEFHVSEAETVMKPTMRLWKQLLYHNNRFLGAKMVELPYEESGFRMVVVLPNTVDGLPVVLEALSRRGILRNVHSMSRTYGDVNLEMPKFEIKSKFKLKNILMQNGLRKMFEERVTGIVEGEGVVVSKVLQEAFVRVTEAGTTAGAFTGLEMQSRCYIPPTDFTVDRPFLYVILHEDVVLFAGTYTH